MSEGVWKKTVSKEGFENVFHSREGSLNFLCPSKPQKSGGGGGLNLDETLSYCTSIQILITAVCQYNYISI